MPREVDTLTFIVNDDSSKCAEQRTDQARRCKVQSMFLNKSHPFLFYFRRFFFIGEHVYRYSVSMLTICTTSLVRTPATQYSPVFTRATRHVEMWSYFLTSQHMNGCGKSPHRTWQILVFQTAIKSILLDQISFWLQKTNRESL